MRDVHNCINDLRKDNSIEDCPKQAAKIFSKKYTLLCFDEMELRDIADAMIIARFFRYLWENGVINERQISSYQDAVRRASSRELEEVKLEVFEKFMSELSKL